MITAPTGGQGQALLFGLGVVLIASGVYVDAIAQGTRAAPGSNLGTYNDTRVAEAVNRVFGYLEGSLGALIMVAAGLGTIISAAFGPYRAALALLVVAIGAFILRSLVTTFFNDRRIG